MSSIKFEFEKIGWINIAETVASFPWPGLPKDVHFSFSYNPNSDTMNLHLTRNVPGVSSDNKPHIRIAQGPISEMEEMARIFLYRYWEQMWVPFDMSKYQYRASAKGYKARYCSLSRTMKIGKEHRIHRQLKAHLHGHIRLKKKGRHLIFQEHLISSLEAQVMQPEFFWAMMDSFRRVPRKFSGRSEIGLLHAKDFTGMVIRLQGQWFTYNLAADWEAVFQTFFEAGIYEVLKEKVATAIVDISKATTDIDTIPLNQPIDLAIDRSSEKI